MSSSAITTQVAQLKIGNVQNQADTSAVYSAGQWSFKNSTAVTSVTITDAGNVGVGVTPSAWSSQFKAIQIGSRSALYQDSSAATAVGNNIYNDGTNRYLTTAAATVALQDSGAHIWYGAASGTAGTPISFTERMRIDASGNLLVGTAGVLGLSAAGSTHITGGANGDNPPLYLRNSTSTAGRYWRVGPSTSAAFIVYSDGNVGVYMSYGATSWTANSDQRMKKNIKPLELGLEQIKALKPSRFDYNTDESEESTRIGFIAQEVLSVLPHAVTVPEDSEQMMGVSTTEMIPVLVKAIQEQQAMIESMKAEIEALKAK